MAKSKVKESQKAAPVAAVAKDATKSKSKDVAKAADLKVEKKSKKSKKAPEPESSESESSASEDDAESSDADSDSDESEAEAPKKAATNGKAKAAKKAEPESDSDESASDSDSDAEEAPKAKANGAKKTNGAAKAAAAESSDSSDSDAEVEAEKADSDDSESDSDDSADSEEEAAAAPSKKRKADDEIEAAPKKAKTDNEATTLFAGSLSWGVDDDILYEAFKEFEGLIGARVVMDRMSGRSRGFGYVDFSGSAGCTAAYEAMQGKEIEGRAINLDYAKARDNDANPRDRANDRAQKHGDTVSPESDTLFVGNLPFDVDQDSVREFFGDVCEVASVRLPTDPESGQLKGFGYVSFNTVEDAKAVFEAKNGAQIGSRAVRLDFAGQRPPQREGGGGFGGGRGGGRGGFGDRGGRGGGRGRGGFGDRGGRGGFGDRGGRGRGGGRGGFSSRGSFAGTKVSFD